MKQPEFRKINQTIVEYLTEDAADPAKLRWLTTQLTRLRSQVQREKRTLVVDRREQDAIAAGRQWIKSLTVKQIATLKAQGYRLDVD